MKANQMTVYVEYKGSEVRVEVLCSKDTQYYEAQSKALRMLSKSFKEVGAA